MNTRKAKVKKTKAAAVAKPSAPQSSSSTITPLDSEVPLPNAFLEEAKKEPRRQLITDHIQTINVLRDEKRLTFRAIADWLTARGIEADHSSVYRAYLAAIPQEQRDPREDWSDVDEPL